MLWLGVDRYQRASGLWKRTAQAEHSIAWHGVEGIVPPSLFCAESIVLGI